MKGNNANYSRFLCEKDYKFSMIKSMLQKKIKESNNIDSKGKDSFFIGINGVMPNPGNSLIIQKAQ